MPRISFAKQAVQKSQQSSKGGGGGGGGGPKSDDIIKELASRKHAESLKGNQEDGSDDDGGGDYNSYLERHGGALSAFLRAALRTKWDDVLTGQLLNAMTSIHDACDVLKRTCEKWTTEGWSQFQALFKSMGMRVFDLADIFFRRNPVDLAPRNPYEDYSRDHDNEDDYRRRYGEGGSGSSDDDENYMRALRKANYGGHADDEHYNPYHSNTRSDGERHYDDHSEYNRRKRGSGPAFPEIAGIGRSSLFRGR